MKTYTDGDGQTYVAAQKPWPKWWVGVVHNPESRFLLDGKMTLGPDDAPLVPVTRVTADLMDWLREDVARIPKRGEVFWDEGGRCAVIGAGLHGVYGVARHILHPIDSDEAGGGQVAPQHGEGDSVIGERER